MPTDQLLVDVADYVCTAPDFTEQARHTAYLDLLDSVGCALAALDHPACTRLLGPLVPGANLDGGVQVPGTAYRLDPVTAAFDIGAMVRWLDFNDTWLAAEWGHPSDNLGALLAAAAHRSAVTGTPVHVGQLLDAMVQAHEVQGVLALANAFNRKGIDHVLLVRVASAALATRILGGDRQQVQDAVSQAFLDGAPLRLHRHAPNVGPRKSWAAGDATSRGVRLALMTLAGEPGYATPLSTPTWGFDDVALGGDEIVLERPFGEYVMDHVLFKISYPAEFHAQTAAEAAAELHAEVAPRLAEVERVELTTHEAAVRIISKTGPLRNPADRDHCLQYVVAVALLKGDVTALDYEDAAAADPRIDELRERMVVDEDRAWSADYLDPAKRSIANAVQVFFGDGTSTRRVAVEFPLGHPRRREEGTPQLLAKFERHVRAAFEEAQAERVLRTCLDEARLRAMPVPALLDVLSV